MSKYNSVNKVLVRKTKRGKLFGLSFPFHHVQFGLVESKAKLNEQRIHSNSYISVTEKSTISN